MIDSVSYKCIGSEVNDGINTELYFHPASGFKIIDTIVNGKSKPLTVDETKGFVLVDELLGRGDVVTVIYKTLPRTSTGTQPPTNMVDFFEPDFEPSDYA